MVLAIFSDMQIDEATDEEDNTMMGVIEARYSDEDLLRIIRAHGVDDTLATPTVISAEEAHVPLPEGEH
jgi:hypothetical protein